ncbi:MAG: glycosyltransferase family 8 protein [Rhodobacterales bacterium]|nr:glycosyltransferase family 8 protein [Rhodobacterales bacterium]
MAAGKSAVVMACDAGYAPYALTLADQIARTHPDRSFDICIFSTDPLTLPPALKQAGFLFETIALRNPFEGGPHQSRHGSEAYLRLMIPDQMAGRYERILYLDCDILPAGKGLDRLLGIPLHGQALAAVRDNTQWRTPTRRLPEFRAFGRAAKPYLNSGVLLIDVAAWLEQDILGQCRALWSAHAADLTRHDQSMLNLVLDGKWTELSPVWNWQYTWSSRFFADLAEPRLVHFIGKRKPWKDTANSLPPRYRRAYADFCARHFPGAAPVDPDAPAWPADLGRSFQKHWWSMRSMQRYLARFPDPFATRPAGQ